jgi:hypothetical protein
MTIGRSHENDIQLRRKCISRVYARLVQEDAHPNSRCSQQEWAVRQRLADHGALSCGWLSY